MIINSDNLTGKTNHTLWSLQEVLRLITKADENEIKSFS